MASNKDLTAEAVGLALALDIAITTDGLNNVQLSALVSDLKAKAKDAEHSTQADSDSDSDSDSVYVAAGKAITSKAGILSAGTEVLAKHLAGGEKALEQLVKGGHCVKGK